MRMVAVVQRKDASPSRLRIVNRAEVLSVGVRWRKVMEVNDGDVGRKDMNTPGSWELGRAAKLAGSSELLDR